MPVYYTIFCGKRQEVFLMRGRQPLATPFFLSASPEGGVWGWQPLHPPVGLPGPHPGFLSFHDERNQRRAGAVPLDPGAWLPHFPRSLRFAPARAVLLPAFLPAALQARQHGGHIPPRLSPPPFGTLIACDFPFPYPAKKLLRARWEAQAVHGSNCRLGGSNYWVGAQTAQTAHSFPNSSLLYIIYIYLL